MVGSGVIAVLGAMLLSCNVQAHDVPVVQEPQQEIQYLGEFKLTAYCSCSKCCGVWAENRPKDSNGNDIVIGASGEVLQSGHSIAVDPDVIPYGTEVLIDGQIYRADDTGGAIRGHRIDIYFNNHAEALRFGVKYAKVYRKE